MGFYGGGALKIDISFHEKKKVYLKAKLTQLMRNTSIARQKTPRRAYIPISRSDSPLVV